MQKTSLSLKEDYRYGGIDAMKHLLAIFVIIIHTWSNSRYGSEMLSTYSILVNLINGAVFGFFLISGYFSKPQINLKKFAQKKFKRLIIPFFIFSTIYAIAMTVLGHGKTLTEYLYSVVTLHGTAMQLYFLPYLFLIELIIIFFLNKRFGSKNFIYLLFLFLNILVLIFHTDNSTGSELKLIPFYISAYLLGILWRKISTAQKLLIILLYLIVGLLYDERLLDALLMINIFQIFINLSKYFPPTIPGSGGVYILHTPILNFLISIILLNIGIQNWYNLIFTVILTYLSCILITYLFIKFYPKYKWILLE